MKFEYEYTSPRAINIGDVFYRVEAVDFRALREPCKVCNDTHEITVNGVTFRCPVCNTGKEWCKINSYVVRRYRVYSVCVYSPLCDTWKMSGIRNTNIGLYHKDGRGFGGLYIKTEINLNDLIENLNKHTDTVSLNRVYYDDYKLACQTAERLISEQEAVLQKFNAEYGKNYAFERKTPNDAKSV